MEYEVDQEETKEDLELLDVAARLKQ